ncbi:MAG: hypothetical protein MUE95_04880, partial [Cyclobacteriaceae bacterium]|nr:hypothetical protein [Cyclobacteriaceae bacterium]
MMKNFTIVFFLLLLILTGHDALAQAEPTNYPTAFTATTTGSISINLTWTGSVGATLPSGYLIQIAAGTTPFEPLPADGDVQADEFDLTDDVAVINVAHVAGANSYSFTAPTFSPVQPGTEYRFRIIPYNSGANINYKIDGTPPVSTAFTRSAEPDNHPGTFTGIGTSISQIRLSFPDAATLTNTAGYIILGRTDGVAPTVTGINDGVAPASLTFPAGTTLVATIASGNTFTDHTGLSTASRFDYLIIPFNYDGSNEITYNYKTDGSPRMATAYTLSVEPTNQPATFTATTVSTTQIDLTFPDAATLGNTSGYIIIRRQDGSNPTISGITDGVSPGSLTLPAGTTLVTTVATGITSFNNTGLTAGTVYNYLILPFNYDGSNNGTHNYKTDGTLRTANAATYSLEPSAHTNFFETLAVSATQVNLNFNSIATAGITNGSGFIILRRQDGTNPTATGITDGVAPGSLTLPAGTTLVTTINSTSTSTFSNTGLTTGTQYNYAIIPFNWNGSNAGTYNYYTAATIPVDNATPSAGPVIVSLNPADDGAAGLTLATATITFNVNVAKINGGQAGDSRTFRLYQVGNATPIATIDKDNAGITGFGTATISIPFAANLTPNTQYYIQAGSNILKIAPNSTAWSGISDNTTWNFTAAATVVEPANPITLCYDGAFQTFGNIVIRESSTGDFSQGASQTYSLILPSGFVFNPAVTNAPLISGSNISAISSLTYTSGNTIVRFSYTITGTSGTLDQITIVGLQVKYTGAFTSTSGNIVRIGGTAVQNGNGENDAQNHGTLSFNTILGEPTFTVEQLPGDPIVPANQTTFNSSARPVKLIGTPAGGVFSGSGVIFSAANSGYIFDIPTVGVGTHPITYSYREPPATGTNQSCEVRKTITFNIITNWINGLLNSYCSTGPVSAGLS